MNIVQPKYPSPNGHMSIRLEREITDLIIHHTAGATTQTPLEIDAEHRARGMDMIGYNYVITPDGTVFSGRPDGFVPAAAYGRNSESVNVSVVGNFERDDIGYTGAPTPHQVRSLQELSVYLHAKYPSIVRTIGHRDVAPMFYPYPNNQGDYSTACPGSELYALIPAVKLYTQQEFHSKT